MEVDVEVEVEEDNDGDDNDAVEEGEKVEKDELVNDIDEMVPPEVECEDDEGVSAATTAIRGL